MKPIVTRALSGAVYVAAIVVCTLVSEYTFALLSMILMGLAITEFERFSSLGPTPRQGLTWLDIAVGACIVVAAPWSQGGMSVVIPIGVVLLMWRLIAELYTAEATPGRSLTRSLGALVYIALPLALLQIVYAEAGASTVLLMFILIWLNDTGAYCVGSAIGRHRLFERISPKKSWEGFFGGLLFCIVCGVIAALVMPETFAMAPTIVLSAVVPIAATWGDLIESLLKRDAGVKDSGTIMPGHGGILDRIDSLLLVAPATFVVYCIF